MDITDNSVAEPVPEAEESQLNELAEQSEHEEEYEEQAEPEIEYEEVDVEGKRYQLPKEVKPYLMRHIDYTQKTMSLADERRAFQAEQQRIQEEVSTKQKDFDNIVKLRVLDENIKQYEQVNWTELSQTDPVRWQTLFSQYTQLKDAKNSLAIELQNRKRELDLNEQQSAARLKAENQAIVARDITGWSPEREKQVKSFVVANYGFTPEEIDGIFDAKVIKLFNDAYLGKHLIKAKPQAVQQGKPLVKPVSTLKSGQSAQTKNPASMSDADYAKWRKGAKK